MRRLWGALFIFLKRLRLVCILDQFHYFRPRITPQWHSDLRQCHCPSHESYLFIYFNSFGDFYVLPWELWWPGNHCSQTLRPGRWTDPHCLAPTPWTPAQNTIHQLAGVWAAHATTPTDPITLHPTFLMLLDQRSLSLLLQHSKATFFFSIRHKAMVRWCDGSRLGIEGNPAGCVLVVSRFGLAVRR